MHVRLATTADAEAIRAIYNHYVENTTSTFDLIPRSLETQQQWIEQRSGALAVIVAVGPRGLVRGFASLSPYKERPAYRTTVEDSVYVEPGQARNGVGRTLMTHLIQVATDHGYHSVIARIADSTEASVGLHSAAGFTIVGVERQVGRKFGRWLDVTVMQKLL